MLNRKMTDIVRNRRPVTLPATATVQKACELMRDHAIGAILVTASGGGLLGIFTGRDAVRLLADGRNAAHTHLDAVMTRGPATITPAHSAMDALRLMQDGGFRHVPVVDGGRIVGIVSHGDFRGHELDRLDEETGYWERL